MVKRIRRFIISCIKEAIEEVQFGQTTPMEETLKVTDMRAETIREWIYGEESNG